MPSCSLRSLCAALCLASAPAAPHAAEPAGPKHVALVLFEKGAPNRGLVQAFLSVLSEIDDAAESISIIGERDLDRRIGPAHIDAVVACGADLRCVAEIGEKADATHVLFGRATAQKGAVGMQWLLVSVGTAEIVGKLRASVADSAGSGAAATQVARELLGVTAAELAEPVADDAPPGRRPAPAAAAATPAGAGGRSRWTVPAIIGTAALASGAAFTGAGVLSHRDGGRPADALIAAGSALLLGGAAAWSFEWLSLTPVIAIDPDLRYAGLRGRW